MGFSIGGFLKGAALGAINPIFGAAYGASKLAKKKPAPGQTAPMAPATVDPYGREGLVGQENQLMTSQQNFDPSSYLNTYAQGAWGSISDALKNQLTTLKGQSVGAGRLNTGFYDEDNGAVINQATKQFNDSIAQQSMGALNAKQRATDTYADLLTGRREELENDYRSAEERKRKNKSGIGGAIGGVLGGTVGSIFPGVGTWAGAALGSGLGSAIGSRF